MFDGPLAPDVKQIRDWDPDRAHISTRSAGRGSEGQGQRLLQADQPGAHDAADRPGIDVTVRVTSRLSIHGADVQTRSAAYTAQRLPDLRVRQQSGASVVHQHYVEFLGSVRLAAARTARPLDHRDETPHRLSGRRFGGDLEEDREVVPSGQHLLDPDQSDVNARNRGRQPDVALVFDQGDRAGLSDQEISSADPQLSREESVSKKVSSGFGEAFRGRVTRRTQSLVKNCSRVVEALVDRGADDVAGWLAEELDDVFAEVGLEHFHTTGFQERVEPDLFTEHALGLHRFLNAMFAHDALEDPVNVRSCLGPVDMGPALDEPCLGFFEVVREVCERVALHLLRPSTQTDLVEVGEGLPSMVVEV